MAEKTSTSIKFFTLHGFIGALAAGLGFIPLVLVTAQVLRFFLFELMETGYSSNIEDIMAVFICWVPAIIMGVLAGLVGAALFRKRSRRIFPLLGAAGGGLFASLIVSLLMNGLIIRNGISRYESEQAQKKLEMRPESQLLIPTLEGEFQELVEVNGFESFAISPNGRYMAYAANRLIYLWDLEQYTPLGHPLKGHTSTINGLDFSPDSRLLVSGSHDETVIVWSVAKAEIELVLKGHHSTIDDVAVSPDGSLAASVDLDGNLILWDLETGQEAARFKNDGYINCLEFSPKGDLLAVCSTDFVERRAVVLWDVNKREPAGQLNFPGYGVNSINGASFSPDGSLLVGASSDGPFIWDVEAREPLGGTQEIGTNLLIDYSPDGKMIVSTDGAVIYLWDAATREPIGKLVGPPTTSSEALFLPDGSLLAYYWEQGQTRIGIWTISTP